MKIKFKDGTEKEFTHLRGANLHGADLIGVKKNADNLE
jgi:hypothetical protein